VGRFGASFDVREGRSGRRSPDGSGGRQLRERSRGGLGRGLQPEGDEGLAAAHGRDLGNQFDRSAAGVKPSHRRRAGGCPQAPNASTPRKAAHPRFAGKHDLPALGGDEAIFQVMDTCTAASKRDIRAAPLIEWAARISDSSCLGSPVTFPGKSTPALKVARWVSSSARNKPGAPCQRAFVRSCQEPARVLQAEKNGSIVSWLPMDAIP